MKLSKLSIWLTLATVVFLATFGIVNAQNPWPIGQFYQTTPFDANPTADAITTGAVGTTRASAYDGELLSSGNVYPASTQTTHAWTFSGFTNSPALFTIGWVDIKLKYHFPTATVDDSYRIEYSLDGTNWIILQPTVAGAATKFNSDGTAQTRSWAKITDPIDGVWDWDDITNLRVRVFWTRGSTTWDGTTRRFYIYELWATVFEFDTMPPAGTSISVQAPITEARLVLDYTSDYCFIEVVVREVTNFAGWQFILDYDPVVLTALDYVTYYPFTDIGASAIDDTVGYVSLAMSIPITDPLAATGVTGEQFAIARIFFAIDDSISNPGMGEPQGTFSVFNFRTEQTILADVTAQPIPHATHNGTYGIGAVPEFPFGIGVVMMLAPLALIGYLWHTRRKVIKK